LFHRIKYVGYGNILEAKWKVMRVLAAVMVDIKRRIPLAVPSAACTVPIRGLELEAVALGINNITASCAEWWVP
jgi:hypothetical protein